MENRFENRRDFENPTIDRSRLDDGTPYGRSSRAGYWILGLLMAFALIFFFSYGTGPNTTTTALNEPSATGEKIVTDTPQPAPAQPAKPATQPVGQ